MAEQTKRELIMATAKSIFIEKGFRGTTIANIADVAGIAKGSVYSYFSSKLDIVKALFLQADEKSQHQLEQLLSGTENKTMALLEQYLEHELQEVLNERSFIQVFLTDEIIVMDSEIMAVVQECRANYHYSQRKVLLQGYGPDIQPWLYDVVAIMNGLLQEYTVYLTLDDANFSIKRCANLISFCLHNSINALGTAEIQPLLSAENFPLTQDINHSQLQQQKAIQLLESMKQDAEDIANPQRKLVLETLSLIESEVSKEEINTTLTRALIANLRPYNSLSQYRRRLADVLDVELI